MYYISVPLSVRTPCERRRYVLYICAIADDKKIPVRHWVLQVREFCQIYFFLEIF
jgi:hypothetical protein